MLIMKDRQSLPPSLPSFLPPHRFFSPSLLHPLNNNNHIPARSLFAFAFSLVVCRLLFLLFSPTVNSSFSMLELNACWCRVSRIRHGVSLRGIYGICKIIQFVFYILYVHVLYMCMYFVRNFLAQSCFACFKSKNNQHNEMIIDNRFVLHAHLCTCDAMQLCASCSLITRLLSHSCSLSWLLSHH